MIKTDSIGDLEALPGTGPVKAQAIIDGRPYQKKEDSIPGPLDEDNGRQRKGTCNVPEGCCTRDRGPKPCLRYIGLSSGQRDIVAVNECAIKTLREGAT